MAVDKSAIALIDKIGAQTLRLRHTPQSSEALRTLRVLKRDKLQFPDWETK